MQILLKCKFTLRCRYGRASTRSAAHAKHNFIDHNLEQFQDSGIKTNRYYLPSTTVRVACIQYILSGLDLLLKGLHYINVV